MSSPADTKLIAALDIGSSKVCALIVTADDDGRLRVLGTGQRESRGVKRGYISDMEASEFAVREAVELAERMSGVTIDGCGRATARAAWSATSPTSRSNWVATRSSNRT
jgi:cell division protein FtsA